MGWLDYCSVAPILFPHQVPCRYTCLLYIRVNIITLLGEEFLGNTLVRFLVCSMFHWCLNRTEVQFRRPGWRYIIIFAVKKWLFVFTLPRSGIQIIVFEAHFRIRFPFLWLDSCVRWGWAGCELTLLYEMKHLCPVGANFAYQLFVIR